MISKQAIIDPQSELDENVEVGPFSIIGPNVRILSGTSIASHVVLKGETRIGHDNKIYQFASIGEDTQDKKYHGEQTILEIGDRNVFREGATVHRGTVQGGGITRIGNDNLFMVNTHVAHDCIVGNKVVFSNGANIAGHVEVDDYVTLGGLVGVHQFCIIGAHSFIGGGSIIYKDVMPFVKVAGSPAKAYGLNLVGLQRREFTDKTIETLRKAYRIIFQTSTTVNQSINQLTEFVPECPDTQLFIDLLQRSSRGIVR